MIPPPLSAVAVEFKSTVLAAAFCSEETVEKVAVILASHEIALAECPKGDHWEDMDTQNVSHFIFCP